MDNHDNEGRLPKESKPSERWDENDVRGDKVMDLLLQKLPQILDGLNKPKLHTLTLSLTNEQLKKVSEVLDK